MEFGKNLVLRILFSNIFPLYYAWMYGMHVGWWNLTPSYALRKQSKEHF